MKARRGRSRGCPNRIESSALLADFYELTMMQGYFLNEHNPRVVFDMFFRRAPFGGGFAVFAGLGDLLQSLEVLRFEDEDLEFLSRQGIFRPKFLDHLSTFRFTGDVYSMDEGTPVFPNEPLLRIHATLMEAQLIESLLLNVINFQTLIATKAARVTLAAGGGTVLEFGLRRAHGVNGAISAARAAFIGGAAATSNTLAGRLFDIPVKGTMGHSWIMSFDTEREAFENYARIYPAGCLLLIDTYDTLQSGIENAIRIGKRLEKKNRSGFGVRLDSGDLESLSKEVRRRLDEAGLEEAQIAASNELDEYRIKELIARGAPIDIWGVGTNLVTARDDSSLTGVYKLISREVDGRFVPAIKISDDPDKTSNPGLKQVYRFTDRDCSPLGDLLALEGEKTGKGLRFYDQSDLTRFHTINEYGKIDPLLSLKMKGGKLLEPPQDLRTIQGAAKDHLSRLPARFKTLRDPARYEVALSENLRNLKFRLIQEGGHGKAVPG